MNTTTGQPHLVHVISDANASLLTSGVWIVAVHANAWCPFSNELLSRWDGEVAATLQDRNNRWRRQHTNRRVTRSASVSNYKLIQQGMVWTFRDTQNMTTSSIVQFASEDWKEYAWFNKLPTTWSVWFKLQLDLFNATCGMLAALEAKMGTLSKSGSVADLLSYMVLVGSVIGIGVLLPFGIVYLT
ncbi:hypothetical protein CcCBS67573_g06739 [Chytriomyces confervae]|uniref:Uncharacterized protein n=1 Tax=Chytriomyces confervae TaxID=246404 RepID=A0A507F168_9FUNG|nr:hypothetical protein CcCBS67573_g06739 [Chytriomyces confervae]